MAAATSRLRACVPSRFKGSLNTCKAKGLLDNISQTVFWIRTIGISRTAQIQGTKRAQRERNVTVIRSHSNLDRHTGKANLMVALLQQSGITSLSVR